MGMNPGASPAPCPPLVRSAGGAVCLTVDLGVYALAAVLRACYKLTGRAFFLVRRESPQLLQVFLQARSTNDGTDALVGELTNEMLDQQIRHSLARETGPFRDLIAAQAFAEGNLLDGDRDDGDYRADPRGIGRHR